MDPSRTKEDRAAQGNADQTPNGDLRHRDIVMALPDIIFITRGGRIAYVNEAGVKLLRAASAEQILGRSPVDFFHPDFHAVVRSRIVHLLQSPTSVPAVEEKMVAIDGTVIDVEVRALSFLSGGESNIQFVCRDITEIKATERALTAAQQGFRRLAEAMPQIIWTAEPDGSVDYASPAFAAYTGLDPARAPTDTWLEAVHPDDKMRILADWAATVGARSNYSNEFRIRRKDGAYRWHFVTAVPALDDKGEIVKWYGSATDVHDRKTAEEERQRLGQRLIMTLESITDAFFTLDQDWRFTYVNNETERLLSRERGDLIGKSLWEEYPGTAGTLLHKELHRAVAENVPVALQEFAPRIKMWLDVRAYPSPEGITVYFRDVTEQRDMEARLRQAQRLEAVGQLTGGIAHDFNNLLTVIIGNAEMMVQRAQGDPGLRPLAELTLAAAERGADLTHRLLAFARRQALEPKAVDVNMRLGSMDALLRRTLGEQVELRWVGARGLWHAFVDAGQLESAVLNLCINARDAMPSGGHITIETANATLDETYAKNHLEVAAGDYVMIAVSDTGTGMTAEVLARAFEPFFTTKGEKQGSGLGLSMVHGFVKQSGGHVKIYTEPAHGTTVKLYLPRAVEGTAAADAPAEAPIVGGREKVLLVEDDEHVRAFAAGQLKDLGYRVSVAANGGEALDIIKASPDFDLLFTDVVMPGGLKGPELAAEARKLNPALRVLYTSGYTENAIVHHGRLDPGIHLLTKPYRRRDLAQKLRQALEAKLAH